MRSFYTNSLDAIKMLERKRKKNGKNIQKIIMWEKEYVSFLLRLYRHIFHCPFRNGRNAWVFRVYMIQASKIFMKISNVIESCVCTELLSIIDAMICRRQTPRWTKGNIVLHNSSLSDFVALARYIRIRYFKSQLAVILNTCTSTI